MNRRALVATAIVAAAAPSTALASGNADTLRRLIDEVVAAGDMSNLESIVSGNVTIAVLGITDIDGFRAASVEGAAARAENYREHAFEVTSIAENEQWAHALVRFTGEQVSGRKETRHVFYVAKFTDGLISELYLS